MRNRNSGFTRLLDHLSGTSPNDERTSRINERGFALSGLFYVFALAVRSVRILLEGSFYTNSHVDPSSAAPAVFCAMFFILLGITVRQRRQSAPVQEKTVRKLHISELPRAAAALLSGMHEEDERTTQAFERGFAVCALLGFAYYGFCTLFVVWCRYFLSSLILLCVPAVLLTYVKLRENILTPPRFAHIRLSVRHLLLRLPVYLLAVLPYLALASFLPTVYGSIGGPDADIIYSDSLLIMFFQVLDDALKQWVHGTWHVPGYAMYYAAMIYLLVVLIHEFVVWVYRKQMQKMDAEENDLS